jgi:hypothetical protein
LETPSGQKLLKAIQREELKEFVSNIYVTPSKIVDLCGHIQTFASKVKIDV